MANNTRDITVNYFRLEPEVQGEGNYLAAAIELRNFIRNIDGAHIQPIPKVDGWLAVNTLEPNNGFWSGSVSKIQTLDIPNKRNPHNITATRIDFDSEQDGLDHPTCFILDKFTNILAIESIQTGVSAISFCEILSSQLQMKIIPTVILMQDAKDKYDDMDRFRKLSFRVARIENLTQLTGGRRGALSSTYDMADATGPNSIYVEIGMGRERGSVLIADGVRRIVDELLGLAEVADVSSIQVVGSTGYHEGESFEPIDLIEQRIKDKIRVSRVRFQTVQTLNERLWAVVDKYQSRRDSLTRIYTIQE